MRFSLRYFVCFLAGLLVALMLAFGFGSSEMAVAMPSGYEAAIAIQPTSAVDTENSAWRNPSHQEPNFYQ